ncbi:MAG: GNAT family N-acetyltransferase [Sphingobacteriales bacterium]|uniref:GNAT family N-acetyltransferase n=1 Tax=Hydrotalea flava TaxID=714549 RepID=UPI00082FFE39|nr:GNAT family protein [Hydrotalea flava]RTL56712.1 MAG: GNAT family N-acetyltransferase [Sphingobacteriales bacterium]
MPSLFPFLEEIVLEDERVQLRSLQADDDGNLRVFSQHEPELWRYSIQSAAGDDLLKQYINKALMDRKTGISYPFIVYDKKWQEYAGCTRFYDIQSAHATMQLGYTWYGKKFQGTGLNLHCKYLLLSFAFETIMFERVEARADALNVRSIAAMKKTGFITEGVLRNNALSANGRRRDSMVLSILRNEWMEGVKQRLQELCKVM